MKRLSWWEMAALVARVAGGSTSAGDASTGTGVELDASLSAFSLSGRGTVEGGDESAAESAGSAVAVVF